jgi:hypothetical protein
MTYGSRGTPFDQAKLELVREFLHREFRGCQLRDYFEFDKTVQVFLIATDRNVRHTLVIPKDTLRDPDFTRLLNQQLVAELKLSGSLRVTLTPQPPKSREREYSDRFLNLWRRATDRARITFVRRPLLCGAAMLALGFGACMLVSSLVWDMRGSQQHASEWGLVRTAVPSDQPQSAVPAGPVSASVTEQACPEERPVMGAQRTASTGRRATWAPGRQGRNLPSNVATSIASSHDRTRKRQADPIKVLRPAPPADPEALRRQPETPQSL